MAHINHAYAESSGSGHDSNRRALETLSPTFFIRPKTTGLVSLFIQVVIIIVSAITMMFFFYHVGGYEYTHWNENSTILEPINHNSNRNGLEVTVGGPPGSESLVSTEERTLEFHEGQVVSNSETDETEYVRLFLDTGPNNFIENASFGIEQVPLTTVVIGDIEFDWLEVIRISTLVYMLICFIWFISGLMFIITIRCEILDAVIFNTFIMIIVVLFLVSHAGLVTSLIFFQRDMSWRTLSITIGSIIIIFCCAFLGFVCISLNCGWIKYIDHYHGRKKCTFCGITILCKKSEQRNSAPINGNAPRDGGSYENDLPLDRFDAF